MKIIPKILFQLGLVITLRFTLKNIFDKKFGSVVNKKKYFNRLYMRKFSSF